MKGRVMHKSILELTNSYLFGVRTMEPLEFFMLNQFLELVIVKLKMGSITSVEQLFEAVTEELLEMDNPFLN